MENRKMKTVMSMLLPMMAMYESTFGRLEDVAEASRPSYTPTPRKRPKTQDDELMLKGLQKFVVNGEAIIAHNLDEAWKRYNHRHKK